MHGHKKAEVGMNDLNLNAHRKTKCNALAHCTKHTKP